MPEPGTLAALLADVGTVLVEAVKWVGTVVGAVVSEPILLIPFSLGLAFTGVTLYHSLRG